MSQPLLFLTEPTYFKKLIEYHGYTIINKNTKDQQFFIEQFQDYNYLIDINRVFAASARGDVIDRTQTLALPFNFAVTRPWAPVDFNRQLTLDQCMAERVHGLCSTGQRLNLFWSGGIDSTAVVTAFMKNCSNKHQLRIVYSPDSIKENPHFFLLLQQTEVELLDNSGEMYMSTLDGINVTGDVADEITASLDESFHARLGHSGLMASWKPLFYEYLQNPEFIDFCEHWFSLSGLEIKTVLDARWWFYAASKIQMYEANSAIAGGTNVSFFNTVEFEHYMAQNINKLISPDGYHTYKQEFKDYIFEFDNNARYHRNKIKTHSRQAALYRNKKIILQDTRYIAFLQDGTRISTDNMPFFSEKEYRDKYGDSLNYLFNAP